MKLILKGGTGSGDWGHRGRPGLVGGSGGKYSIETLGPEWEIKRGLSSVKATKMLDYGGSISILKTPTGYYRVLYKDNTGDFQSTVLDGMTLKAAIRLASRYDNIPEGAYISKYGKIIYTAQSFEKLSRSEAARLSKLDEVRVLYNVETSTWHIASDTSDYIDHGDFTADALGNTSMEKIDETLARALYYPKTNEMLLYKTPVAKIAIKNKFIGVNGKYPSATIEDMW